MWSIFFIILVANIGGALTPLGDPPLFVGFLRGVDFFWTAQNLWLQTAIMSLLVLALFVAVDLWFVAPRRLAETRIEKSGADPDSRPHQFRPDRAHHRGDPAVGGLETAA